MYEYASPPLYTYPFIDLAHLYLDEAFRFDSFLRSFRISIYRSSAPIFRRGVSLRLFPPQFSDLLGDHRSHRRVAN